MTPPSHNDNVTPSTPSPPSTPPPPQKQQTVLLHPHDDDIVCGRGPTKHPGNRMYNALVTACRDRYTNLPLGHKKLLAQSIVDALHPSRFLIKQETSGKPKEQRQPQSPYHFKIIRDNDNRKRNSDDLASDDEEQVETDVLSVMSDFSILESTSFDTAGSSTHSTGTSTPTQQESVSYYVVLDHAAAIRKTSQALREKGGSTRNAARDGEQGGVALLNNRQPRGIRNVDGDYGNDAIGFPHDVFQDQDENDQRLPANKKPRRGYGEVATLSTLPGTQNDAIVTFPPVPREVLEQQVELRFSHIQAMLNKMRSKPSEESNHGDLDGNLQLDQS